MQVFLYLNESRSLPVLKIHSSNNKIDIAHSEMDTWFQKKKDNFWAWKLKPNVSNIVEHSRELKKPIWNLEISSVAKLSKTVHAKRSRDLKTYFETK